MKRLFCISFLAVLLICSCEKPIPIDPVVPVITATSLEDGATDVSVALGKITVTWSVPIEINPAASSLISLNDSPIENVITNKVLTITFDSLSFNTEYTLIIPHALIINKSDLTPAESFTLTFTTEEQILPPLPPYIPTEPGNYSQELVTPNAIPNATALYKYLLSIYGSYTLSGAMARVAWNTTEVEWIHTWTNKWPAVAYFDYIHLPDSPSEWIDYSDISPVKNWWEAKGLVGTSWHWIVPTYEGSSEYTYDPSKTTWKAANVLIEGTWENTQAKADLEKISGYLLQLQAENIPVIWRPMHEAAGNIYTQWHSGAWFWWGDGGAEVFRELWKFMFDFFKEKGVRNLIWVWVTQTSKYEDTDYYFYPGDEYVDITGRDIYNNTNPSDLASQFYTITHMTSTKMVALSENGGVSDINTQWNNGAKWLLFMPWYDYDNDYTETYPHQFATIEWWKESFKNPAVLDRSELPYNLFPEWAE